MKWLSLLAALAVAVSADRITGTWKASVETPTGRVENTFVFVVHETQLTGTVASGTMEPLPISDGKVDGDNLSFVVVQKSEDHDFKMVYTGRLHGDELRLTLKFPVGTQTVDMIAKKVS